jgi:glycerate 2-kinase
VKQIAQRIFRETLAAIDIPATLAKTLASSVPSIKTGETTIDLREFRHIVAIAYGKAAFAMADGLTAILSPRFPMEGILVVPARPPRGLPGWRTFLGGHPVPNEGSFAAGRAILDLLARCDETTLIFFLVSGGGSSLVEQPLDSTVTLGDFQKLNHALVRCGASIEEINIVRKHLSATKGGRLAAAAPRSMKLTFAISDVPEGQESALASGPTLPDPSTIHDAAQFVRNRGLVEGFPSTIRNLFERHALRETPKEGDLAFVRSHFQILLGSHDLMHAAHRACEASGYVCLCDNSIDGWPLEKAADHLLSLLEARRMSHPGWRASVAADGELSSPVTGDGVGGRNSAFVLACVPRIAGKKISVFSAGTDGIDGNSPAAGAVADGETLARANAAGLDPFDFYSRSDAYSFFSYFGDAVQTGPTGNNLRDLRILLAEPQGEP